MLHPEDIIDGDTELKRADMWAGKLLESVILEEEDQVGIVGLGTGCFIALALAKSMISVRRKTPAGVWMVFPPTRLPWACTNQACVLLDAPLWFLTHEHSVCGPGWRY